MPSTHACTGSGAQQGVDSSYSPGMAVLFIAQCLNGIEMRSLTRRIKAKENPHGTRKNDGEHNGFDRYNRWPLSEG